MGFEDELRRAMHERAAEIAPGRGALRRTRARYRRQRARRWWSVVAALASVVALSVVVVPRLPGREARIDLAQRPAPAASTASATPPAPSAPPGLLAPIALVVGGGLRVEAPTSSFELVPPPGVCAAEACALPVTDVAARPDRPDGPIAVRRGMDCFASLTLLALNGDEVPLPDLADASCAGAPAWLPTGELLAVPLDHDADPRIALLEPDGELGTRAFAAVSEPLVGLRDVRIAGWLRYGAPGDATLGRLVLTGRDLDGRPGAWTLDANRPVGGGAFVADQPERLEGGERLLDLAVFSEVPEALQYQLRRTDTDGLVELVAVARNGDEPFAPVRFRADTSSVSQGPRVGAWHTTVVVSGGAEGTFAVTLGDGGFSEPVAFPDADDGDVLGDSAALGGETAMASPAPTACTGAPSDPAPCVEGEGVADGGSTIARVYFNRTSDNSCAAVWWVEREVSAAAPATGALRALVEGPSDAERADGVTSWFSAETAELIRSVRIADGIAFVDLAHFRGRPFNSTSCGSEQFFSALDATLQQFPTVRDTRYLLEGDPEAAYLVFGLAPPE